MPLIAISMDEYRASRGDICIVIDEECEIGHGFMRSVSGHLEHFLRGF